MPPLWTRGRVALREHGVGCVRRCAGRGGGDAQAFLRHRHVKFESAGNDRVHAVRSSYHMFYLQIGLTVLVSFGFIAVICGLVIVARRIKMMQDVAGAGVPVLGVSWEELIAGTMIALCMVLLGLIFEKVCCAPGTPGLS